MTGSAKLAKGELMGSVGKGPPAREARIGGAADKVGGKLQNAVIGLTCTVPGEWLSRLGRATRGVGAAVQPLRQH